MPKKKPADVFNCKDAAAYLGITPQCLSVWLHDGCAPAFVRFGKRKRFLRITLDAFKNGKR